MRFPLLHAAAMAVALLSPLATAAPLSLDQALDLAVQRSDALRAARAGVASATEAAHAAGQSPDPTLRVGIDNLPFTGADRLSTTRDSMTMKRIGIGQEWLSAEKRSARQAAADAMVGREVVLQQGVTADTRLQTAFAYLDAYYAGEALALTTQMEQHAVEELEAAKARLASATGSSQEVLAMQSARGRAEDESAELMQLQNSTKVALERWVAVPIDDLMAPTVRAPLTQAAYVASHPAVLTLQRDVEVARQEASVAASNRKPTWSWEVSYGQRTGYPDMVSFGVSIPLPVARAQRQDRETASRLALVDRAEAGLAEAARAATAEYRALTSDAQQLAVRIERYRSAVIVPAQQRVAVAMAAYRSNQASLLALFETRHAEVEAQRKLLTLRRELAKVQAQLAYKPLDPGVQP